MSKVSQAEFDALEEKVEKLTEELENQTRGKLTPEVCGMWGCYGGDPTLNSKIQAIAEHLGLDFTVKPEKVVASKATVTKKGKK